MQRDLRVPVLPVWRHEEDAGRAVCGRDAQRDRRLRQRVTCVAAKPAAADVCLLALAFCFWRGELPLPWVATGLIVLMTVRDVQNFKVGLEGVDRRGALEVEPSFRDHVVAKDDHG